MSCYFVGYAGQSRDGKLHLFPEDERTGFAFLRTVCPVESRVENLLRSNVDESDTARDMDDLRDEYGDRLCANCVRRAEA